MTHITNLGILSDLADKYADSVLQPGEHHPDWHSVRDEEFARLLLSRQMVQAEGTDSIVRDVGLIVSLAAKRHLREALGKITTETVGDVFEEWCFHIVCDDSRNDEYTLLVRQALGELGFDI